MAVCKRSKTTFNTAIGLAAIFAVMGVFAACGGDSGSGSDRDSDSGQTGELVEPTDSDIIAATFDDLPVCSGKREGTTAYVKDEKSAYVCEAGDWNPDKGTDKDPKSAENTSSSTSQTGTKSSSSEDDAPEGFVREDISVTGVAQKGPFKFGSPLTLNELKKDLKPSGLVYEDEISSNKGDFVIPKVSLVYPYAKLEVCGLYRNEVTGEWSKDSMTLRALTDFSEKRTEVNINLLTHLEYDRVLYLVQEKGYSVYAAKKQAAQEIMTAFEFATAVTYSEDFTIFQNEGVSATTSAGNATLLAISALVMGNRSDVEIQNVIDNFIADIKTDGEWNDLQTKADMADWAYDFSYSTLKASVKSWNILDIPAYETYLDIYWNNVYGLGGCSVNRKDIVAPNSNKLSKNFNKYFICNGGQWVAATTYQKDTYEWTAGKTGECKKGNVTDTVYVYDGSKWVVSERETAVGLCGTKNAGVVSKFENVYYICRNNAWTEATALEYDTYGLKGVEGDVKAGIVNKDKYYVYENGEWRASADEIENNLGACVTSREGEKQMLYDKYYACESKKWKQVTEEEFGLGHCSDSNEGVVSKLNSSYYICKNNEWQTATNVEQGLGGCILSREGEVVKFGNIYYICKSKAWTTATVLEYDTYGEKCSSVEVGKTIDGVVTSINRYKCTSNGWESVWSWNVPKENLLNSEITYGTLTDNRDGKTYKTVKIGSQTWMAENLNYADSVTTTSLKGENWCFKDKAANCEVAGRLYTWAAAMDSVKTGCGYQSACSSTLPVQGICPAGWHLPSKSEWGSLIRAVGGKLPNNFSTLSLGTIPEAGSILKSQTGWNGNGNGADAFGFSALPVGIKGTYYFSADGDLTKFWCSTENGSNNAFYIGLDSDDDDVHLYYAFKMYDGLSVRCLKDSN